MTTPRSLELQVDVEIPEQVAVSYTVAGLGSRAAAALVDAAICVALYGALYFLAFVAIRAGGGTMPDPGDNRWVLTLLVLGQFAIFWGYYVLWEGLRDGQTPGKRRFGLRVVRDGGFAVDFAASAARNLVRAVDMQPGLFYGVGIGSVLLSGSGKRLGDYVAGTIVVRERAVGLRVVEAAAQAAPGAEAGAAALATLLSDDEFALLSHYVERSADLAPARRAQLAAQLAARLRPRTAGWADAPPATGAPYDDALFLDRLHAHEIAARRRGVAARSDTGARREQHAIVARGAAGWAAFAQRLQDAQARGLDALGEEEVSEFVAHYRELTTDLARLQTATRGRDVDAVYYLSRLVAGGHNLLYRGRRTDVRRAGRFVLHAIPAEIRRSWRPIALAALLLFGPAIVAFEAVRRSPEAGMRLVGRAMVDRAETGVERARTGGGYLPEEIAEQRGALLTSQLATNNVRVTYVVFAGGATAGLLTVFMLVMNGVGALGAPLGLYARYGIIEQILAFVAPHGVLELTAICLGGGAGFHLAAAILLPGALTRRDALVARGRRALVLVAGSTLLLICAGLLEGYVSPLVFPLRWKLAISAATAVVLVWYVGSGWWGANHTADGTRDPGPGSRGPLTAPPSP